jgi:quinol monooxygenase YgiN
MINVVELRQYTLRPGQRDVLIELFDREFLETQEAVGMRVFGQFRDADDPDRFVWVRGFENMVSRRAALAAFYAGPAWKANSAAANATMVDSDNVLLLRPRGPGFELPDASDRPSMQSPAPNSVIVAVLARPGEFAPDGGEDMAVFETEDAENTFPALPVRTGEQFVITFRRFEGRDEAAEFAARCGAVAHLTLLPTTRSQLR